MRKLRPHAADSLDMLLDTLCNVFGSIILISCLLALITNTGPTGDSPTDGGGLPLASRETVERRLTAAEETLRGLKELQLKRGQDADGPLAGLVAERDELRRTQERLRADRATAAAPTARPPAGASVEEVEKLRDKVREAEKSATAAGIQKNAAELTEKELLARLEKLKRLLKEQEEGRHVEYVRFPKERDTSKEPFNLILKHGEIFPTHDRDGRPFPGLNRKNIEGEEDAYSVEPRPSEGWRPGRDLMVLRQLLAAGKRNGHYASIHVYPDSFEVMRALRPLLQEAGLEFGMQILPQHYIMVFSPKGSALKPL